MDIEKKKKPEGKQVAFFLPPKLVEELDAQAEAEGLMRGRATIVRKACAEYLMRHGQRSRLEQQTQEIAA